MTSLCFSDAVVKRNKNDISKDEYLQTIVDHCTGIRHGTNRLCNHDTPTNPELDHRVAFARDIKDDRFASATADWVWCGFIKGTSIKNTVPLLELPKAYRSNDVVDFKATIPKMDEEYDPRLCRSTCRMLATLALEDQNKEMLKGILEVHEGVLDTDFNSMIDDMKYEGRDHEIIRIVEDSGFKS